MTECLDYYLNLLAESEDYDIKYDFQFLTREASEYRDNHTYWFQVGEILGFSADDPSEIYEFLVKEELSNSNYAGRCLFKLHKSFILI